MKYKHGLSFEYPEDIHGHMISPKQVRDENFDENFPYYDSRFWFRVLQVLLQIVMILIVFPVNYFRYGCRIKGKTRLIRFRRAYRNGCITVCNHVFEWDYICVRSAMAPKRGYVTVWKENHNSDLGKLMRVVGSIPIPDTNNIKAMHKFNDDIGRALNSHKIVHFYPEGSMWYYYQGLREFMPGAFYYAVTYNKPVFPLAISFRPPRGLFKLWKRNGAPCVTIEIGRPVYPNQELTKANAIKLMSDKCFKQMQMMMEKNTPDVNS